MRVIKVTGKGVLKIPPDTTRLTISLSGTYPEYADALKHSAEDTERLKDTLEALAFPRKDLKTLSFDINAEYESYKDENGNYKKRFVGYKFSHVMKLEFSNDNDLLARTLHALSHNAWKLEIRISYTVKDVEAAKNELLGKAVRDAKAKAETLARAAELSLGGIQNIDYSWGKVDFEYRPTGTNEWSSLFSTFYPPATGGGGIAIEPDDIEVSDTVTVVWEIS